MSAETDVNLAEFSISMPNPPTPEVHRSNVIETITTVLSSRHNILVVEGKEGIGKTVLLSQFVRAFPKHAFSLFLKSVSRFSYDPLTLRFDLASQLNWLLKHKEIVNPEEIDQTFLNYRLIELQRNARRHNQSYYFVIDGLDEVPPSEPKVLETILGMLPLGQPEFKFLFSGDLEERFRTFLRNTAFKTFPLTNFILDETSRYFEDLNLDRKQIQELHNTCGGVPGHLSSVRRIIEGGISVEKLILEMPQTLPELFQFEWRSVDQENKTLLKLLAILAHDRKPHTVDSLAQVVNMSSETISTMLGTLRFVLISEREVGFVSESFRSFAADQLIFLKKEVQHAVMEALLKKPESRESLLYLPGCLQESGQYDDLLTYLSPDNLRQLQEHTQSLTQIKEKAELGLSIAAQLKRDGDLLRFSLQTATIMDLYGSHVWKSEVEALVALNDYESALLLAQKTLLKEDKLHLLAIVAKAKYAQGLTEEPEIKSQIETVFAQLDYSKLGDRAIEIAADLIVSAPQLALELVERATRSGTGENILDKAYTRLSLAILTSDNDNSDHFGTVDKVVSRIKDPKARDLLAAVSNLSRDSSVSSVLGLAKQLRAASEGIFLLRQWANANRRSSESHILLQYALEVIIGTTTYAPSATVLLDLAAPLPYIADIGERKRLVGLFDALRPTVEKIGPTEDYIKFYIVLARAERDYDFDAAVNRVVEIYLFIEQIIDVELKANCLASLYAALPQVDPSQLIERSEGLHSLVNDDLQKYIVDLLDGTAEHFKSMKSIVQAVAETNPQFARDIVSRMNLQERRDKALLEIVKIRCLLPTTTDNLKLMTDCVSTISVQKFRSEGLATLIDNLAIANSGNVLALSLLQELLKLTMEMTTPERKCKGLVTLLRLIYKDYPLEDSLIEDIKAKLHEAWLKVDPGWLRVDIGFKIAQQLADCMLETAKAYLKDAETLKSNLIFNEGSVARTYVQTTCLAVRAYSGIVVSRAATSTDFSELESLIAAIPSKREQARLWADLCVRVYLVGRSDECSRIVSEKVRPILEDIKQVDDAYYMGIVIRVAPALYFHHKSTALQDFSLIPQPERDYAYFQIAQVILLKCAPDDPYEGAVKQGYPITYADAIDVCEILNLIEKDHYIYRCIRMISATLSAKKYRTSFTEQQKKELIRRLEAITSTKFPSPNGIQHHGYVIASKAETAFLLNSKTTVWQQLVTDATKIPNHSDSLFVLMRIAGSLPARERALKNSIYSDVFVRIGNLPSAHDRVDSYDALARECWEFDQTLARKSLKAAMQQSMQGNDSDLASTQIDLIDHAYRFDPQLAASLATLLDQDPAREEERETARHEMAALELQQTMLNASAESISLDGKTKALYPQVAHRLLASLLADRTTAFEIGRVREIMQISASFSLREGYPILAWAIENIIRKYAKGPQANNFVVPMFSAAVMGAQLVMRIAGQSSSQLEKVRRSIAPAAGTPGIFVSSRGRESAIQYIADWLSQQKIDRIKICDPYFGPDDLEAVRLIQSANPSCKISILTSKRHHKNAPVASPWDETYKQGWRLQVSDQLPPDTELVIAGTASEGLLPIHDRWWICEEAGLRFGTSFNGLGRNKASEISVMNKDELSICEAEVDKYLNREVKVVNGERMEYQLFTL